MKNQISLFIFCAILKICISETEINFGKEFIENAKRIAEKSFKENEPEGNFFWATVNQFGDEIMENFGGLLLKTGFDPMPIPDIEAVIEHKVLLVKYTGHLNLTQISLKDLSTVKRYTDVLVTYDRNTKKMELILPMAFDQIEFDSHFKVKIMGISNSGRITGSMKNLQLTTTIQFDFNTFNATVPNFKITHSGHITVDLHKIFLVNWLVDIIANTVTTLFKSVILNDVDGVIRGCMQQVADIINTIVFDISNYFYKIEDGIDITPENVFKMINKLDLSIH